jgi:hypothetical protein
VALAAVALVVLGGRPTLRSDAPCFWKFPPREVALVSNFPTMRLSNCRLIRPVAPYLTLATVRQFSEWLANEFQQISVPMRHCCGFWRMLVPVWSRYRAADDAPHNTRRQGIFYLKNSLSRCRPGRFFLFGPFWIQLHSESRAVQNTAGYCSSFR